jgi:hypothetical protein
MNPNTPSLNEMFVNLSGALLDNYNNLKKNGVLFADEATAKKRIDICMGCKYITSTMGFARCELCGCGMAIKARLAVSACPINKWIRMSPQEIDAMVSGSLGPS